MKMFDVSLLSSVHPPSDISVSPSKYPISAIAPIAVRAMLLAALGSYVIVLNTIVGSVDDATELDIAGWYIMLFCTAGSVVAAIALAVAVTITLFNIAGSVEAAIVLAVAVTVTLFITTGVVDEAIVVAAAGVYVTPVSAIDGSVPVAIAESALGSYVIELSTIVGAVLDTIALDACGW